MDRRPPSFWELAVEATTSTRQGYNLLAPRFESTAYATPSSLIESCQRRVEALYGPLVRQTACAADLACGTGRGAFVLAQTCARVEGFDFSPLMLAEAKRKADVSQRAEFEFLEVDLSHFQLPQARYDRIVTFGAWGHILPEWQDSFLQSLVSGLKPGGVFYTVTADEASKFSRRWWISSVFDQSLRLRNRLLGDPFHMYYRLNHTLEVYRGLQQFPNLELRLEPVPGSPHPDLTLLLARCIPGDTTRQETKTDHYSKPEKPGR